MIIGDVYVLILFIFCFMHIIYSLPICLYILNYYYYDKHSFLWYNFNLSFCFIVSWLTHKNCSRYVIWLTSSNWENIFRM